MNNNRPGPKDPKEKDKRLQPLQPEDAGNNEGGDDNLENSSPTDGRSDEKVIVNEQRANKTVNAPSQTAAHTSEGSVNDEEIIN